MRRILIIWLAGLAGCAAVGAGVVASGAIDMSARRPPLWIEQIVGETLSSRSARVRAPRVANPIQPTPEALGAALGRYRQDCLVCHGAPGVERGNAGNFLNPPAPDLVDREIQAQTDGELFWFIQNGVRMTGMPAWGEAYGEREIWELVALVRHLSSLTDEERERLEGRARADSGATSAQ